MVENETEEAIVVKKSHILAVVGAVIMISFFVFAASAMLVNTGTAQDSNRITGQAVVAQPVKAFAPSVQGGKQSVTLTIQGSTYYPSPVRLKKGVPAVLDVDLNSVRGCFRGIQIPAFNVRKTVSSGNTKIEFTPDKAGTFAFSCFMGMGKGQIVVEDENGNVPVAGNIAAAQAAPAGGSCGSGGCGCGG